MQYKGKAMQVRAVHPSYLYNVEGSVCGCVLLKVVNVLRDAWMAQALHTTAHHSTTMNTQP
jgi:hypothetical protein